MATRPLENISNLTFTAEHLSGSNCQTWVMKGEPSETKDGNASQDG
jgi:hypothetical protein